MDDGFDERRAEAAVRELLAAVGLGSEARLALTPGRVARMLPEILEGVFAEEEPLEIFTGEDTPVLLSGIRFFALCEHHLLPFYGTATVGYIPDGGRITGLGSLIRVIDLASRRLTLQEHLTEAIADRLEMALRPKGVFVKLEADQLCIMMRGPRQAGARTVTTARRGICRTGEGMALLAQS